MLRNLLLLCTLIAAPSFAQTMTTLRQEIDHHRLLLIFAPRQDNPQLLQQLHELQQHVAACEERDLRIVPLTPSNSTSGEATATLSVADQAAARRRFHIAPNDFTVLLLGKDGGEKLRSSKSLSFTNLSDTIDAMPMRQREMRSR